MTDSFYSLLSTCERQIARKRELPSVSFEYAPYIQTNRILELIHHPEFPTVRNHALCYAAEYSDVTTIKTLLNHGADFTTGDALYHAATGGNMPVVQFLVDVVGITVYEKHIYATYSGNYTDVENYILSKYVPT